MLTVGEESTLHLTLGLESVRRMGQLRHPSLARTEGSTLARPNDGSLWFQSAKIDRRKMTPISPNWGRIAGLSFARADAVSRVASVPKKEDRDELERHPSRLDQLQGQGPQQLGQAHR